MRSDQVMILEGEEKGFAPIAALGQVMWDIGKYCSG